MRTGLLSRGSRSVSIPEQFNIRNRLLKVLPAEAFAKIRPLLTWVDLPLKHVLVEAHAPTTDVYFIESGLASVVATSSDDEIAEVGHIGREGMTATHLILMSDLTPNRTFMQVAGGGFSMPAADFME